MTSTKTKRSDDAPASNDVAPGPKPIRIPHPSEIAPRHRPTSPRYEPRRDRRDAPGRHRVTSPDLPVVKFAEDGGPTRIKFDYRNGATSTSAQLSIKAGRAQYGEGPWEQAFRRLHEVKHQTVDFQFQTPAIIWPDGEENSRLTLDCLRLTDDGSIIASEIKASRAFFEDPKIKLRLAAAEAALEPYGISLERAAASEFWTNVVKANVWKVMYYRNSDRTTDHVEIAREIIAREGGAAPLRLLRERLHPAPGRSWSICAAMIVRREIGFDLQQPLDPDMLFIVPRTPPRGAGIRQLPSRRAARC